MKKQLLESGTSICEVNSHVFMVGKCAKTLQYFSVRNCKDHYIVVVCLN